MAMAGRSCLHSHITRPSVLANSPTERGQRVRGCLTPKWLLQRQPPSPQADKRLSRTRLVELYISVLRQSSWPVLWLSYSWTRVLCTRGSHRLHYFQECFLWRDTCFAGLQSRWPETLGSQASSPKARPASAACRPGAAPAHNSPVIAPTSHLLQCRPCALQNVRLIKTIMGAYSGLFFPSRGC